jgi:hypothetical protein
MDAPAARILSAMSGGTCALEALATVSRPAAAMNLIMGMFLFQA